jgi:uncharacterized protein YjiS (DUF1127 family)
MPALPIAYLILAHNHPRQLARMVRALDSPAARFIIHIDAKADLRTFENALPGSARVHYLRDRVRVEWMGWSIVEATLRMVREAMRDEFGYAVFLSGADYPIKPREEIESFYANAREEFICFWRLEDRPSWLHKVQYFHPVDWIPVRGWATNTEPSYWRRLFWGRWFKYMKYMPRRRFPHGLVPYGGPDWWSLSRACLAHVLECARARPALTRFFRCTASPGELFFQTVVMNSPFASRVRNFAAYEAWREQRRRSGQDLSRLSEESFNDRYVDWSGEAGGGRETPAVLDQRDWDNLRTTPSHFARKFDPVASAVLLDRIDAELLRPRETLDAAAR